MNADTQVYVPECKIFFFSNRKKRELILSLWQHQTFNCSFDRRYGSVIGQSFGCGQNKIEHGQLAIYFYSFFLRCCFYYCPTLFATFVSSCKLESLCANDRTRYRKLYSQVSNSEDAHSAFRKGHF